MSNFASRPEQYGHKYDSVFESSLQSPIPDKEKLQYFRSMFENDVRSYLTDEDRQGYFAKGVEKGKEEMVKALKEMGVSIDTIAQASGFTPEEIERCCVS